MSNSDILAAREQIEFDPQSSYQAASLLLQDLDIPDYLSYEQYFPLYIEKAVGLKLLSPEMLAFDLPFLAGHLVPARDQLFQYQGLKILVDRYLVRTPDGKQILELPQIMWMRIAMGHAIKEVDRDRAAITFYDLLSQFFYLSASPTQFNAGRVKPQMSSCYLSTTGDDIDDIFKTISDNAKLSKWAGGLGNDWTGVRALGSIIKGTNGNSQGVIPFLKIVNDTVIAVNQGGKRPGAACVYIENWHLDIEDFLDLRKNTGDERRRCHDLHTALWLSDEFMRRAQTNEDWTLFSPDDVPDLHDLYGSAFAKRYREYEQLVDAGHLQLFKRLPAKELWRKTLTRLFETGHPWLTFKDAANIRNPQDHVGVIHSSNLCTEILLNTSKSETAVCNLGSINLMAHVEKGRINYQMLSETIELAVRMLDNVIDLNYYPIPEARASNLRHRPIGLGVMGWADILYKLDIPFASQEAVNLSNQLFEFISYHAIVASTQLASQRGPYPSYPGSKWDRGLLPCDTLRLLNAERQDVIPDLPGTLDWDLVRVLIAKFGMRNSNLLAIAPTATISNIVGVSQSIEPTYKNLYVKSNLSGEFTVVNEGLVSDLQKLGLWNRQMLEIIKYYDGSIQAIKQIPTAIRARYQTAFEMDPNYLLAAANARQKWIDQGQSLNLYLSQPNGRALSDLYLAAWRYGLKTTYYLRTQAATQVEKSTVDINKFGIQPRWMQHKSASADVLVCNLADKEHCESCQ